MFSVLDQPAAPAERLQQSAGGADQPYRYLPAECPMSGGGGGGQPAPPPECPMSAGAAADCPMGGQVALPAHQHGIVADRGGAVLQIDPSNMVRLSMGRLTPQAGPILPC